MSRLLVVKAKLVLLVLAVGLPEAGKPAGAVGEPALQVMLQTGHTQRVSSVALSGDGKYLVTGSLDKTAILWEASSGKKLQTFQAHNLEIASVALSADGKHLVTGSTDQAAILW